MVVRVICACGKLSGKEGRSDIDHEWSKMQKGELFSPAPAEVG